MYMYILLCHTQSQLSILVNAYRPAITCIHVCTWTSYYMCNAIIWGSVMLKFLGNTVVNMEKSD